jgi:hypothetical protein
MDAAPRRSTLHCAGLVGPANPGQFEGVARPVDFNPRQYTIASGSQAYLRMHEGRPRGRPLNLEAGPSEVRSHPSPITHKE